MTAIGYLSLVSVFSNMNNFDYKPEMDKWITGGNLSS